MSHEKAIGSEKFRYDVEGGTIVLPSLKFIKSGVIRKLRKLDETDQMFSLFETLLPEDQLDLVDELTGEQLTELATAWRDFSGVSMGESAASSS